jgi:Polysaccharide lyase
MSTRSLAILSMIGAWLFDGMEWARAADADVTRNFETNSLSGWRISGNAPSVQSSTKRLGRYGMRTYLDRYQSNVPNRTEVRVIAPDPKVNQEYWYAFSIYLPDDYVPDNVAWEIVAQWHQIADRNESATNPPLSLSTSKGVWKLGNKWTADPITKSGNVGTRSFSFGTYARGRWTDWVFRIKWSYGSDGILEAWKNGQKLLSARGPNTYNDDRMPYFKMGIYKGWKSGMPVGSVTRRTLFHDEFRMLGPDGSYLDVAPRTSATTLQAPSEFTIE